MVVLFSSAVCFFSPLWHLKWSNYSSLAMLSSCCFRVRQNTTSLALWKQWIEKPLWHTGVLCFYCKLWTVSNPNVLRQIPWRMLTFSLIHVYWHQFCPQILGKALFSFCIWNSNRKKWICQMCTANRAYSVSNSAYRGFTQLHFAI